MQFVILGLALSFLYKSAESSSIPNSCGDRADLGNEWDLLCIPNPDKTLNVTFACNEFSNEDEVHLQIWYPFYPPETKSLTIQNCKKLYLSFDIEPKKYVQLRHLHVKNIHQLSMDKSEGTRCLPQEVTFEYIQEADFSMPLISDDELCKESNYSSLETLELFNMAIRNLPSNFIWEKSTNSTKMERFYMYDSIIEKAERNAIVIPKLNTFRMQNTTVKMIKNHFIDVDADDYVTVMNSNFMNIPRKSSNPEIKEDLTTFAIKAKSMALIDGNTFDFLGENSLKISSDYIAIQRNTFKRIEENAFKNIGFSTKEPERVFRFDFNRIHYLSPGSITSPAEKLGPVDSDRIRIGVNKVVCSCDNLAWFDWLSQTPNKFNNDWFNDRRDNSCFKVPCELHQISKNYSRLCEKNYECSELPPEDLSLTKKGSETSDRVMGFTGFTGLAGFTGLNVSSIQSSAPSNLTKVNQTKNDKLNGFERLLTSLERNNNETFEIIKLLWAESRKTNKN